MSHSENRFPGEDQPPPSPPQRGGGGHHPMANYQFSSEELRVLKECNSESFFKRSLPMGTAFGVSVYMAVKNGMLKGNPKYGAIPKVIAAVTVGYFMGKFSYQQPCAEKIMRLPNSRLAEILRAKKKGGFIENITPDQGFGAALSLAPFSTPSDQYSDVKDRSTSLNLDTERPSHSGLDDTYRPNLDTPGNNFEEVDLPLEPPKHQTTYDELRQRNREEYVKKQQNPLYRPVPPDTPPVTRAAPERTAYDEPMPARKPKNKYGDEWTQ